MSPNNIPQTLVPLHFPTVQPRRPLVEEFSRRINGICSGEAVPDPMIFLLFQREMMLRRRPDPTLVSWANSLEVEGAYSGNNLMYTRYLLRKWLACLPPLFIHLSCLKKIEITEDPQQSCRTTMSLSPHVFTKPAQLFETVMTEFIKTIPFFFQQGQNLRESTLLLQGSVFTMEEWWQSFLGRFLAQSDQVATAEDSARGCIASRLAEYLAEPDSLNTPSEGPTEVLVDILAHAAMHSYIG